jgi:hypothetical protein
MHDADKLRLLLLLPARVDFAQSCKQKGKRARPSLLPPLALKHLWGRGDRGNADGEGR